MPRLSIEGLWPLLLLILAAYLLLLAVIFFSQSRMLFLPNLPSRALQATPADLGMPFEPVRFETEDGVRLHGWFLPAAEHARVVLFFHGNAGNISHRLDSLRLFRDLGLSVFIFDYRGYGQSEGSPGEAGSYRDAEAAWRHLTEARGIQPRRILLFGRSLGGAVAVWLASRQPVAGLIVESTFTSLPDLAAQLYPWAPARWLARIRYPSLQRIAGITAPTLVVHSRDDEIIPFAHGRRLYEAVQAPKQFLEITGGHNDAPFTSGTVYIDGLRSFIVSLSGNRR